MTPNHMQYGSAVRRIAQLLQPLATLLAIATALQPVAFSAAPDDNEPQPLWLVIGTPPLVEPLGPLVDRRRGEGFETRISTQPIAEALQASPRRPDFLLFVGDDETGAQEESWFVPARRRKLYRWRAAQRDEFASDAAWGDMDGDLVPDIPVGRIPARTPNQVRQVVDKILAYERRPPAISDLKTAIWLGSPEYGPAINTVATSLGLVMLRTKSPSWLCPWVVSGNAGDPFCGIPSEQPTRFTRQLQEAGLCSVLMGHASCDEFFSMRDGDRWIVYNAPLAADQLAPGAPIAPMFVFSCESGNFARPGACMAESFLWLPGGPVATIAATTESHPLTNYFSGRCLLQGLGGQDDRLGSLWLRSQRRALRARDLVMELTLRDVEGKLEQRIDVPQLRRDQILMYALLGDPATRLRLPRPLEADAERTGERWRWQARRPAGAQRIEIGFRSAEPLHVDITAGIAPDDPAAALARANESFRFTPLPSPAGDEPWEGTVDQRGWIRLVAVTDEQLYVAVLKLD